MKKTILLIFVLLLTCFSLSKAQVTINVAAPIGANSTFLAGPDGTQSRAYWRCVELITANELMALTSNSITSVGFVLGDGTSGVACPGNITVYMENTNDVTFNKSSFWSTAITGMNMIYSGVMTVPISVGATVITLPLSSAFSYTGGGIYLAFDWVSTGPFASIFDDANYMYNSLGTNVIMSKMSSASVGSGPPPTINSDYIRPTILFGAVNTAVNELGITALQAPGKVSKLAGAGHVISSQIKNVGNSNVSGVTVTLSVIGANTFSTISTIGFINPGSVASVSFAPFYPTANGMNTITVTLPVDENISNNEFVWTQSVTCDILSNSPPLPATSFANQTWGSVPGGILATQILHPAAANLSSVGLVFGQDPGIGGKDFHAVLADANGSIIATSNTISATAQMIGSLVYFDFYPPPLLNANSNYYVGVAYPPNTFPFGSWQNTTFTTAGFFQSNSIYEPTNFYLSNSTTGGPFLSTSVGYLGIEAVLSFSNTTIQTSATKTLICKGEENNSIILNASGASTYTWSNSASGSSIVITPTITGEAGSVSYTVNGFNQQTGCRAAKAIITIIVDACTDIRHYDSNLNYHTLFPNPSVNGKFSLTGCSRGTFIDIFNSLGQRVLTHYCNEESGIVDLAILETGSYIIRIENENHQPYYIKAVNLGS